MASTGKLELPAFNIPAAVAFPVSIFTCVSSSLIRLCASRLASFSLLDAVRAFAGASPHVGHLGCTAPAAVTEMGPERFLRAGWGSVVVVVAVRYMCFVCDGGVGACAGDVRVLSGGMCVIASRSLRWRCLGNKEEVN